MKKIKFNIRCGFTLAELLIAISLIGILAAITMPTLKDAMPDKYDAMRKKAEYELEQKVADIVNDDLLYGDTVDANGNTVHGLRNMYYVNYNGKAFGCDILENMEESKKEECKKYQKQKFCKLLAAKFDLAPGTGVNCEDTAKFTNDGGTPSFISRDGIEWLVPVSDFNFNEDNYLLIAFKTSVKDDPKAPHCFDYEETKPDGNAATVTNFMQFINKGSTKWGWGGSCTSKSDKRTCIEPKIILGNDGCRRKTSRGGTDTFVYKIFPSGKLKAFKPREDRIKQREH